MAELSSRGRIVSILHILPGTILCSILLAFISKSPMTLIVIIIIYVVKCSLPVIVITGLQADDQVMNNQAASDL